MKVFVISFCQPEHGIFGLFGNAFFDEGACKKAMHQLQEDKEGFVFTMDDLDVEVTIQ